jgi:hypothetical protein
MPVVPMLAAFLAASLGGQDRARETRTALTSRPSPASAGQVAHQEDSEQS